MKIYMKQNPPLEDREDLAVLAVKFLRGKERDWFKKQLVAKEESQKKSRKTK